jgi:hypothetical protein
MADVSPFDGPEPEPTIPEERCPGWIGDVQCTLEAGHWHWWHTHDSTQKVRWEASQ